MESTNDSFRISAFDAISYGCGERAKVRAKRYAAEVEGSMHNVFGKYAQEGMARVEGMKGQLIKQLPPALPKGEIDR